MPYVLGIDIGSTTTTAAVSRLQATGWSAPELVHLGARSHSVPSVLHVGADGALTVADSGQRDAGRVARGFSRRIGDDVPLIVGGEPCPPQALTAVLAMWVAERVLAQEGEPADRIVLSHPATWGSYRKGLLRRALWDIGLADVTLLPEPVVTAESHARHGWAGGTAAVYSLGGNDFEASVVGPAEPGRFRVLGCAAAVDPFGGADVDEALATHLQAALDREFRQLPRSSPQTRSSGGDQVGSEHSSHVRQEAALRGETRLARYGLRRESARAKERLTTATETEVLVSLPHQQLAVRVTRAELDELVRPALQLTVDLLARTVHSCGVGGDQLDGVLLAGGAAQLPLVAELLAAELPGPVRLEPEPQHTAATGAAVAASKIATPPAPPADRPVWTDKPARVEPTNPEPPEPARAGDPAPAGDPDGPPPRPPVRITPLRLPRTRTGQRRIGLVGGAP